MTGLCTFFITDPVFNSFIPKTYRFHDTASTWFNAMTSCHQDGGKLGVFDDVSDVMDVIDQVQKSRLDIHVYLILVFIASTLKRKLLVYQHWQMTIHWNPQKLYFEHVLTKNYFKRRILYQRYRKIVEFKSCRILSYIRIRLFRHLAILTTFIQVEKLQY